mmetsp:Transcript_85930/g.185540  ORF Transcript_85930/g.185540 Transcript_85930/m.185540 type:complete len:274 (+) Transcript_85930:154-975(+)
MERDLAPGFAALPSSRTFVFTMVDGRTAFGFIFPRASGERCERARTRPLGDMRDMRIRVILPPRDWRLLSPSGGVRLSRPGVPASPSAPACGVEGAGASARLLLSHACLEACLGAGFAAFSLVSSGSSSMEESRDTAQSCPFRTLMMVFPLRALLILGMVPQRTRLMRPEVEPRRTSSISSLLNSSLASSYRVRSSSTRRWYRCCSTSGRRLNLSAAETCGSAGAISESPPAGAGGSADASGVSGVSATGRRAAAAAAAAWACSCSQSCQGMR